MEKWQLSNNRKGGYHMAVIITPMDNKQQQPTPRYVSITEAMPLKKASVNTIPSKTLIINELNVTIVQDFDEEIDFKIDTKPGVLSDNKTIPKLDITAKEDIEFDEDLTLARLESIIRRCGILDDYKGYFTNDPEIIINQYTLTIKKTYRYFNEFREGIMIAGDIVS
jgi:hypothetical protein